MSLKLPSSLSSPQDLQSVITELKNALKLLRQEEVKAKIGGHEAQLAVPELTKPASELLAAGLRGKPLSPPKVEELIQSLEQLKGSAPQIHLTLAAIPTASLKQQLVTWCREHIAEAVLVHFQFNSTILGGIVVRYGSHVYDWSFRRQLLAGKDDFTEVLRRV